MATVQLEHVRKVYEGGFKAVHDFNLEIKEREFIVLVGPSGCGKSTTLRMIAGLEDITSGTISIGGKVMNEVAPKDRDIAMVFQSYALYPHMTVFENMAFALKLRKLPKPEITRRSSARRHAGDRLRAANGPRRYRAVSASASRSVAPSCASRSASCSTSRCPTWTRSCASRCAPRSSGCTWSWAARPSTSRTIRKKR